MGILSRLLTKGDAPDLATPSAGDRWSAQSASRVLRHFPLGSRILYSPEAKRELRLESFLMGYTINGHPIYSRHDLERVASAEQCVLRIRTEGAEVCLAEIKSFYMLVPFQSRSEVDFKPGGRSDPDGKLVQKPVNDFERGNLITIVCYSPFGRVPSIGALVRSTATLTSGPYANHRVVILDPLLNTLTQADKRRHQRLATQLPAVLQTAPEAERQPCTLEDFSERFVRVRLESRGQGQAAWVEGKRVILSVHIDPGPGSVVLQAVIFRRRKDGLVLELKTVLRDGRFTEFHLVDQLELKSAFLHHPSTSRPHPSGKPDEG